MRSWRPVGERRRGWPAVLWAVSLAGTTLWICSGLDAAGRFFRDPQFRRGDANADGIVDVSDMLFTMHAIFGGPAGRCLEAQDSNDDGQVDASDAVYTLLYLFAEGTPPPHPGPAECGVVRDGVDLGCDDYGECSGETALIVHALNRITFGPTEELLTRIQTKTDLVRYIEEQLNPPENYDPAVHEPELWRRMEELDIGFRSFETSEDQFERLKGLLIENSLRSEWQLLHVLAHFWNNHLHTHGETLAQFFSRGRRGSSFLGMEPAIFDLIDADGSEHITEEEWSFFRSRNPSAPPYSIFRSRSSDGALTEDELEGSIVSYWKYGRETLQDGVAAELERREYELLRRLSLGRFRQLVMASARSVPMLIYLNSVDNRAAAPNENYARELLELSTLGVDNVYTQRDIEELARVLTGWTVGWVRRADFDAADTHFQNNPSARTFPLDLQGPEPYRFPTAEFWDDRTYTWAFVFGQREAQILRDGGHDWGRKDLFLPRYGGTDSLGNPLGPEAALTIVETEHTPEVALLEFDLVLDRVMSFRDTAKFISTKLIQLFVTDDLSRLAKTRPMPARLRQAFAAIDLDGRGAIEAGEWATPVPLVLPNGRPPHIFATLDADRDGVITPLEYQEPDLLLDAMDAWSESRGNMRDVVRAILLSEEFLSLKFYRAKVKTPYESTLSALRSLEATLSSEQLIQTARDLADAGMEMFDFGAPTGESELGFDWIHTVGLLERIKYLNRGAYPESESARRFDWDPRRFMSRWRPAGAEETVDLLSLLLLGGDLLDEQRQLAVQTFEANAADPVRAAVAFLLSLPQFQKQ